MRGLMIAAMAVVGLTWGGQASAQDRPMATGDQPLGGPRTVEQVQSANPEEIGISPVRLPAPQFDPRAEQAGTGGSGSVRSETLEVKGIVRSVSDKGMTLTLPRDNNRIMTLRADDQVQLLRDNAPLALSSLKLGEEVRASYQFNEEGQRVIRGLEVIPHGKGEHKK